MTDLARHSPASRTALWFGLFGGAIAWMLHLMLAFGVAEFGCVGRLAQYDYLNITLVAWLELALTAVTTAAAAAATAVALLSDRRLQSSLVGENTAGVAERFTARAGVLTSGTFTFVIVFESIPILYFLQCC